jgi:CubicO group peptidase (beta-lactamase class C family)
MIRFKLKTLLFLLILVTQSVYAQINSSEVDSMVIDAMKKFNIPGAAVAIVKDGKIIHKKGYGVTSVETNQKVDENTNFAIASNSKAFTTAALAILVEEGKLAWTDKVKTYIPEFWMYDDYLTENFNIQDLLTHRSGLGLGSGDLMFFPDGADFTITDVLSSFQYFKPVTPFRTRFGYNNLLYMVAGEVVARVSGMSWEKFVKSRIMEPLGMNNSYCSQTDLSGKTNVALPHASTLGTLKPFSNYQVQVNGAAGGIYSNVNNLSKWLLVHLNRGKYGENSEKILFSESSQNEMWKIHTTFDVNRWPRYNSHFAGYGLGWELKDSKGNLIVSHTGGLPGMCSKTILIPDLNLGLVVLTNSESGGTLAGAVTQAIVDRYLGLDDFKWVDMYYGNFRNGANNTNEIIRKVWETVDTADNSQLKAENFIGMYEDKWFGKVEVLKNDNQLWFRSLRSPKLNGPMRLYKDNTFAIKWEYQDMNGDAFATFSLDKKGQAQSIQMKGISPDIDFSFDYQDLDLQRIVK